MNKFITYFIAFLSFVCINTIKGQVAAPSLRCLSVGPTGDVTLTWVVPPDPSGQFQNYQIYNSPTQLGPWTLVTTINSYAQNSYVQSPANGNMQSQYYYMVTTSNGPSVSTPSDTLRTVFLNLVNLPSGIASLSWNATRTPLLPSAATTYTVLREYPAGTWTPIYTGTNLSYKDTINICSIYYRYRVETSDAAGCVSQSNIKGDLFHDANPPGTPLLDSVSVTGAGQVTLGWQPSTSPGVTRYIIYEIVGGIPIAIDTLNGLNSTSYTYTNSNSGTTAENYCIAAMDSCKNISILSIDQKTMFLSSSYDLCSRTANLTWTAYSNLPKGVLRYDVYCSVNGAPLTFVGSSTGTTFSHSSLNPGDTYCYTVRAVNNTQNITAASNTSCVLAKAPQGPSFVYLNSVSVNLNKQVEITYSVDNTKQYKGATIFRSLDGITFTSLSFNTSTINSTQTFVDTDVNTTEKNYFYKIQLTDSCGNPGSISNISKTIVLKVTHDNEGLFYNTLTWDAYTSWSGTVASYNIYRAVNGVYDPTPIGNVGYADFTYVDNVQDFVSDQGKFSYYIEAVEAAGNIYGFMDKATSNPADAYVEVNVFVPNAFAPRGLNNVWLPVAQYVEKTDYKVMVFNRWGTKVFETASDTEGWTGTGATDDVYVYIIEYKNARGEYIQLKGHLNVVR